MSIRIKNILKSKQVQIGIDVDWDIKAIVLSLFIIRIYFFWSLK